ncbi:MAG: bicyclomycin resistance protein [Rubrivivax sp.]|nr:bicyclomycin resistance protein [Rubrivivax sp.]
MQRRRLLQQASACALLGGASVDRALAQAAAGAAGTSRRQVLRLALNTAEVGFDPVQINSDSNSNLIMAQIFESPLMYDYLASPPRLLPRTAAELPEISADGRVFTVRIRPGIFFADDPAFKGARRELIAADYVYALKRYYDPQYNSGDLYLYEGSRILGLSELRQQAIDRKAAFDYDTPASGARVLDRYTFRIELGVSDPRFVYRLAECGGLGAVAREVVDFYGPKDVPAHPVGTGAYRLKSWRRGSRIVLERSPSFRGEIYAGTPAPDALSQRTAAFLAGKTLPLNDEIVFDVVEEAQPRWLSFLNGSYDILNVPGPFVPRAVPGGRLAPYLARQGIRLQQQLEADMVMSYFNMEHPLVGGYTAEKVALRRAISLGFDVDAFIRQTYGGLALRAQSTLTPHTSGYDPAYKSEMGDFDPVRARALLETFGYRDLDGDGYRELPDGRPLQLLMAGMSTQQDRAQHEIWKRSMDRIGLRMGFEISNWPDLLKRTRAGSLMMWGYSWLSGSPDGSQMLGIAYGPNAAESNDARFDLPLFNRLFERQQALPDGAQRQDVMRQAKDLLVAYMPYKTHCHRMRNDLLQPQVQAYVRHPFMRDIWRFVDVSGLRA